MKTNFKIGWLLLAIGTLAACSPPATYTIRTIDYRDSLVPIDAGNGGIHMRLKQYPDTLTVTVTSEEIGNRSVGDTVRLNNSDYCCEDFIVIAKQIKP